MATKDVVDGIISSINPEEVPLEFIVMAKITDHRGVEKIIKGQELEKILGNPEAFQVSEARVILDVTKLRKAIVEEINYINDEVEKLLVSKSA